jgi:predicted  nucleic acid-binding Zn ribbon protein
MSFSLKNQDENFDDLSVSTFCPLCSAEVVLDQTSENTWRGRCQLCQAVINLSVDMSEIDENNYE